MWRRLQILAALVGPMFVLVLGAHSQEIGDQSFGPRQAVCCRCWVIFTFYGGGDGSWAYPAGYARKWLCHRCQGKHGPGTDKDGQPPAGDLTGEGSGLRDKYRGASGAKPTGPGGGNRLKDDKQRLKDLWDFYQAEFGLRGSLEGQGKPTVDAVPPRTPKVDAARVQADGQVKAHAARAEAALNSLVLNSLLTRAAGKAPPGPRILATQTRFLHFNQEAAETYRLIGLSLGGQAPEVKSPNAVDYYQPLKAEVWPTFLTAKASGEEKLLGEVLESHAEANAYLKAYQRSLRCLRAAQEAKDGASTAVQAANLVVLARKTRAAAQNAAVKEEAFLTYQFKIMCETLALAQKKEGTWQDLKKRVADGGLPDDLRSEFAQLGVSKLKPETRIKEILQGTLQDVEASLTRQTEERQTVADVRKNLAAIDPALPWPETADALALLHLEAYPRAIFERTAKTGIKYDMSVYDYRWWVLPAGHIPLLSRDKELSSDPSGPLWPGKYDIWLAQNGDQTPMAQAQLIYKDVLVEAGKTTVLAAKRGGKPGPPPQGKLDGSLAIELAPASSKPHSWFVLPHGATSTVIHFKRTAGSIERLPLPTGKYDLFYQATAKHEPVVMARAVDVAGVTKVALTSGIRLRESAKLPKRDADSGWWGVTLPNQVPKYRVHWTHGDEILLIPPGTYDVYWVQAEGSNAVRIAAGVKVEPRALATVRADSGVRLKLPEQTPDLDAKTGWWGAVPAGAAPSDRLHWAMGRSDQALLLPPGRYDLYWEQSMNHATAKIKSDVVVTEGNIEEVAIPAWKNVLLKNPPKIKHPEE